MKITCLYHSEDLDGICSFAQIRRWARIFTENIDVFSEFITKIEKNKIINGNELRRKLSDTQCRNVTDYIKIADSDFTVRYLEICRENIEKLRIKKENKTEIKKILTPEIFGIPTDYETVLYYWTAFITLSHMKGKIGSKGDTPSFIRDWKELCKKAELNPERITSAGTDTPESNKDCLKRILQNKYKIKHSEIFIICDLSTNSSFTEFTEELSRFFDTYRVFYYDHHHHPENILKIIENKAVRYVITDKMCSGRIIYTNFFVKDRIAKLLSDYAHDSDFKVYIRPYSLEMQVLIKEIYRNCEMVDKITVEFSEGKIPGEVLGRLLAEYDKKITQKMNSIIKNIVTETVEFNGLPLEIAAVAVNFHPSLAGDLILKNYYRFFGHDAPPLVPKGAFAGDRAYLIIGLDVNTGRMNLKSNMLDVAKIASVFGGGGHTERAGVPNIFEKIKEYRINIGRNIENNANLLKNIISAVLSVAKHEDFVIR